MNEFDSYSDTFKRAIVKTQLHMDNVAQSTDDTDREIKEYIVYLSLNIEFFKAKFSDVPNTEKLESLFNYINSSTGFYPNKMFNQSKEVRSFLFRNGFFSYSTYFTIDIFLSFLTVAIVLMTISLFITRPIGDYVVALCIGTALMHVLFDAFNNLNFYRVKK